MRPDATGAHPALGTVGIKIVTGICKLGGRATLLDNIAGCGESKLRAAVGHTK